MTFVRRIAPVLIVDAIVPCAQFRERLGFVRTVEVPHGDAVGFVIVAKNGVEVMYQSLASVRAERAGRRATP